MTLISNDKSLYNDYKSWITKWSKSHSNNLLFITLTFKHSISRESLARATIQESLKYMNRSISGKYGYKKGNYIEGFVFQENHKDKSFHYHLIVTSNTTIDDKKIEDMIFRICRYTNIQKSNLSNNNLYSAFDSNGINVQKIESSDYSVSRVVTYCLKDTFNKQRNIFDSELIGLIDKNSIHWSKSKNANYLEMYLKDNVFYKDNAA